MLLEGVALRIKIQIELVGGMALKTISVQFHSQFIKCFKLSVLQNFNEDNDGVLTVMLVESL